MQYINLFSRFKIFLLGSLFLFYNGEVYGNTFSHLVQITRMVKALFFTGVTAYTSFAYFIPKLIFNIKNSRKRLDTGKAVLLDLEQLDNSSIFEETAQRLEQQAAVLQLIKDNYALFCKILNLYNNELIPDDRLGIFTIQQQWHIGQDILTIELNKKRILEKSIEQTIRIYAQYNNLCIAEIPLKECNLLVHRVYFDIATEDIIAFTPQGQMYKIQPCIPNLKAHEALFILVLEHLQRKSNNRYAADYTTRMRSYKIPQSKYFTQVHNSLPGNIQQKLKVHYKGVLSQIDPSYYIRRQIHQQ